MHTTPLRRFVSAHQPSLIPALLAFCAGALSLRFTVRACWALSPADSAMEVGMLGLWFEAFKLYLGPCALLGLFEAHTIAAKAGNLALLALTLVFMSGSVGATFMFTTHTEAMAADQKQLAASQALEETPEYREALLDRETLNARIARASGVADGQAADNQRRLSMGTDAKIDELQAKKDAVSARIKAMRAAAHISDDITASSTSETMTVRELVHLAVAILLEVGSIAAFTLVHIQLRYQRAATRSVTSLRGGGLVAMDGGVKPRPPRPTAARRSAPTNDSYASGTPNGIGHDFEQQYIRVRELVIQGIIAPTLHAIMDAVHVSQRPAQRFREALCGEGLVQRDERGRYRRRTPLAA